MTENPRLPVSRLNGSDLIQWMHDSRRLIKAERSRAEDPLEIAYLTGAIDLLSATISKTGAPWNLNPISD